MPGLRVQGLGASGLRGNRVRGLRFSGLGVEGVGQGNLTASRTGSSCQSSRYRLGESRL